MATEMERIGELLKLRREQLELTLKACENATSIRAGFLDAIEKGNIRQYLPGIYVYGFVQQYGRFLEIDTKAIVQQFPEALSTHTSPCDCSFEIGTIEMRASLGGGIKWLPNLFWALVVIGVVILAYSFAKVIGIL